jgi:beta-galactosidase
MTKALGLNALSVYVMWNYHEIEKGKFDYQTGNRNLPLFLELAEKHEMKVLFRPGPFVCAEWDFGGFPGRLLNIHNLTLRANNQPYLDEVKIYFQSLVPIMKSHLQTTSNPNGSIILLQIEN